MKQISYIKTMKKEKKINRSTKTLEIEKIRVIFRRRKQKIEHGNVNGEANDASTDRTYRETTEICAGE